MKPAKPTAAVGTYEVGYGKPPLGTRFQKGQSGNPSGRPKGSANITTIFRRALEARIVVTENGRRRTRSKVEVAITQLMNQAAGGNLKAIDMLTKLLPILNLDAAPDGSPDLEADRELARSILSRIAANVTSGKGE